MAKGTKQAVIYMRYSPRPNEEECKSIEKQLHKARQYCTLHEYTILREFEDKALSGGRADNRPGFQAAVELACKHGAIFLVYSLSRAFRNTRDAIEYTDKLNKCGAEFVSLNENFDTTTSAGRMIFTIMSAFAEFERNCISERTRDAMRYRQDNGERMGRGDRLVYGCMIDPADPSRTVENPDEKKIIRKVVKLRCTGLTTGKIGKELMRLGLLPRKAGGKWHPEAVKRILKREGVA